MRKSTIAIVALISALSVPSTVYAADNSIAPTNDFLVERLSTVSTITQTVASAGSKQWGYQNKVSFVDQAVTDELARHNLKQSDTVDTMSGGCIEVFAKADGAKTRNDYLTQYDGKGFLDPGAHQVLGTCVIRVSKHLTTEQQTALTEAIKNAILSTDTPGQVKNPTTIYNRVDYAAEYDAQTYYNNYPDLQAAFGTDGALLIKHYVEYGKAENRKAK